MFASLSSRVVLAVAALATVSSAAAVDKRQVFTCATGTAACCRVAIPVSNVTTVLDGIPIFGSLIEDLLNNTPGGIPSLKGQVGVLCGPDIDSGCDGETPLCCGSTIDSSFADDFIATDCTDAPTD